MLKNKKGFTLIELIAVIAILGIILILALPQVSKVQQANKNRKYEAYEMSIERGSKLYTDSNAKDMFGNNNSGCVTIPYSTLKSSNVIKDFSDSDITCSDDSESYVRIRKINDDYRYDVALICRQEGDVVYKQEVDTTFACTNSPDTEVPIIEASPSSKSDWVKSEDLSVTIKISDASGLNKNTSIKYYWVNTVGEKVGKEYTHNYNNKEGVTKVSYKIPKKNVVDVTGEYYLVIEPYRTTTANGVQDVLGNDRITGEQFGTYKIDNTKPSCAVADGEKTTWTNTDFTITQHCSDGESGCAKETYSKKFTTSTTTYTFTIKDNVGNTNECKVNVYLDKEKPSCGKVTGESTEWTNQNRTISVKCNEEDYSKCKKDTFEKTFSTEGKTDKIEIEDNAGNKTQCEVKKYIDKTPPKCPTITASTPAGTWTNKDITYTFKFTDDTVKYMWYTKIGDNDWTDWGENKASVTQKTISTEGYRKIGVKVYDAVGNEQLCGTEATYNIDKSAPSCGAATGASTTWTNKDRYISQGCNDSLSGCSASSFNKTFTTEGKTDKITIKDKVGNTATCTVNKYIDKTNPTCISSGGSSKETIEAVTIIGTCSDSLSGCTGNVSKTLTSDMNQQVSPGTVKDNAGNTKECPTQQVNINTVPKKPTISNPTNGNWVNYNFALTVSTTSPSKIIGYWQYSYDNRSWTTYANSATNNFVTTDFSLERNQLAYIRVCNKSGACSESASTYIRIDKTGPNCGNVTGASTTWTNKDRYISQGCNDSGSGCSATTFNKTFTTQGVTDKITIKDKVGNTNSCTVNKYIDKTKPTLGYKLTDDTAGANYTPGTWSKHGIYRDLYPSDTGGSGVKEVQYNDGAGWYTENYLDHWWIGETNQTSKYRVIDNAGNISDELSFHYMIDWTPPACPSISSSIAANTWTNQNITFTFGFSSDTSKYVWYTKTKGSSSWEDWIDWGENSTSIKTKTISGEGLRKVAVRVYDSAGNSQLCGDSPTYKIDKTAPYTPYLDRNATMVLDGVTVYVNKYGACDKACYDVDHGRKYSVELQQNGDECFSHMQCNVGAKYKGEGKCLFAKRYACGDHKWTSEDDYSNAADVSGIKSVSRISARDYNCLNERNQGDYSLYQYWAVDNAGNTSAKLKVTVLNYHLYAESILNKYYENRNYEWALKSGLTRPERQVSACFS